MKTAVVRLVSTLALAMTASILSMENSIAVDAKGAASKRVLHYRTLIGGYLSQSYELEVFDNGDVIYTGLSNVKRVGTVRWTVSPGEIEVLVKKIWPQYDAPIYPESALPIQPPNYESNGSGDPTERPPADGGNLNPHLKPLKRDPRPPWYLEVGSQGQVRAAWRNQSSVSAFDKWLRESLEQAIPTKSLRCPFLLSAEFRLHARRVLPAGSDLCALQNEWDKDTHNFVTK